MRELRIAVFAAAFAFASVPAIAVDLPDYGSKNFSPSNDTPAYLANESLPVAARTADTAERDWSEVDAIAPERRSSARWHHRIGRHGRYAFFHASARHAGGSRSAHFGKALWTVHVRSAPASVARHGRSNAHHASAAVHPRA